MTSTHARRDAWATLGTDVSDTTDVGSALAKGGLAGWNVTLEPVETTVLQDDGVERLRVPGKFAVTRTNPDTGRREPMGGVFTKTYHPVQNETLERLCGIVAGETGARVDNVGQLNGGNRVFVQMRLPDPLMVGGGDPLDLNLVAFNSFDASSSLWLALTPIRLFCANQQSAVLRGAQAKFSIRHTRGAILKVEQIVAGLRRTNDYVRLFGQIADRMVDEPITESKFTDVVKILWPRDDDMTDRQHTIVRERDSRLLQLLTESATNVGIRGTHWAAYQAVTEYLDHYAPVRVRADNPALVAQARADRVASGVTDALKDRAWQLLAV